MGAKERCVGLAGRCSNNVQKIKNVEKFMKAHYELLQTLVEKIAEKTSNVQLDTTAIEDTKKLYSEQIRLLQEEIQRLKAENSKLQDQVVLQDLNQFHDVKDSLLETIKKNSLEPRKEDDLPSQEQTADEVGDHDSDSEGKRVSFNTHKNDKIQKESIVSFQLEAEILEESDTALDQKEDIPETEQETAGTIEDPTKNVEPTIENDAPVKHVQLADPMYYCACTPRDIQVQTEETVVSTETNSRRIVNTVSSTQRIPDKSKGETGDVEIVETTIVEDVQSQSVTMVNTTVSGPRPKTQVPVNVTPTESEKQTAPVTDDIRDTKNDVLDQDIPQGESHEVFEVDHEKEKTAAEVEKGEDTVDGQERTTTDTPTDTDSSKVKPTVEEVERRSLSETDSAKERSSVQNAENISSEPKRLSNESVGSKERSSVQNAENVSSEPKRPSNESVGSKERSSVPNAADNSTGEPKPNIENGNTNDAGDVTVKLNEIRDKVIELVQKQSDACKDLEMLKTEMSISRDSTNECTENIAKLKETIEDQKETFVENFKEHKTVTDNLSQVNDKIQQELSELKSKIETLFKNVNDLKNTRREKSNGKQGDPQTVSLDDDLITIEECQYELYKLNKTTQDPTGASVGIPTAYTENVTQNITEVDSQKNDEVDVVPAEPQLQQTEEDVEKLEKQYTDLKKESKEKDKQIKCINALISYYSKAKKDVMAIHPSKGGDVKCKCGDDEINNYIEKVRDENRRLKVTISSVIEHLNVKMNEIKGAAEQTTSRFCLCMPGNETRLESESYQSDVSSVCSNCVVPDNQNDPTELQIEDIYKVVCRTYAPSKGARYQDSSSSCVCNKNAKSSYTCFCKGSLASDQEVNIEDIYKSVLCACGSKVDQTADNLIPSDPSGQSEKLTDSTQKVTTGCQQECVLDTCDKLDKCSGQSLMTNLQTYVNYLHEQLDIISSIENRIEDLRVDIKTPQV
jgi:hypothetical protein